MNILSQITAFIPAKGTSSRVPAKNQQLVNGVPLFLWAANNLHRILPKDRIVVDSDSKEILADAERAGFRTLTRPADLATNATDGNALMRWHAQNCSTALVMQHLPPMIFCSRKTLLRCVEAFEQDAEVDSVLVGYSSKHYQWDENVRPLYDLKHVPNSVDLKPQFYEGMGLYLVRKSAFDELQTRIGRKPKWIELPKIEHVDIDYPEDLELARAIAAGLPPDSEYLEGLIEIRKAFVSPKKGLKLLVCDVDGVLTDGRMHWSEQGNFMKVFHNKDGIAIKKLRARGIDVIFFSAGPAQGVVENRAKHLGVNGVYTNVSDKKAKLSEILAERKLSWDEIAYIGDEEPDLPCLEAAGFACCPADSDPSVRRIADLVLTTAGGNGCLRELETWI